MLPVKSVNVLGRKIKVTAVDEDDGTFGYFHPAHGRINLCPKQDAFSAKDTLLHECLHAVLHTQGHFNKYAEEERYVRPLAPGIIKLLRDNPKLTQWLLQPE